MIVVLELGQIVASSVKWYIVSVERFFRRPSHETLDLLLVACAHRKLRSVNLLLML
jgi:hypothetical protein